MNALRSVVSWGLVASLGCAVGIFANKLPLDVNSVILSCGGGLAAIATSASFQVLRKFDDLKNAPYLDSIRLERLQRKLDRRKKAFCWKWALAVLLGIIVAVAGQVLKTPSGVAMSSGIVMASYAGLAIMLWLDVLVLLEYAALARLGPDLNKISEREAKKESFLRKVRA
jgi:hypothetical protein